MTKLFNHVARKVVPERTLADVQEEGQERIMAVCDKCGKSWNYAVSGLIESHGVRTSIPLLMLLRGKCCTFQKQRGGLEPCEMRFRT